MLKQLIFLLFPIIVFSQSATIKGRITDEKGNPLGFATVISTKYNKAVETDIKGFFLIALKNDSALSLLVKYLGYKEKVVSINIENVNSFLQISLQPDTKSINEVQINALRDTRTEAGLTLLNPKDAILLPSAFGDFNKILAVLPGVVSNNELSSTYSVRGGNYDENLIYVNGMEVYRPFLVRSGQQEGLSFVNPNLASSVEFSSGGWQAKFGDKLSSIMNVSYKTPKRWEGSGSVGLLGGTVHLGGTDKNQRISFVAGFRNKTSKYLLNTLPTQGQYLPSFNDFQSYITIDLTDRRKPFPIQKRTTLGILTSYAGNQYEVNPVLSEANFGTNTSILKLTVAFDGNEKMNYDTWQNGLKLTHWTSENIKTEFYASAFDTREREYINLQAYYRLCDLEPDGSSQDNLNKCASLRGAGSQFRYGRNSLHANVYALENRNYYYRTQKNTIEFGVKYSKEIFDDQLYDYSFIDSLDFIKLTPATISTISLNTNRYAGYLQSTHKLDTFQTLTYGLRLGWWDLNQQFLISPSIQYAFKPQWKRDVVFRLATGIYRQPPFYRELRNFNYQINSNLKAQSAVHFVAGSDYRFKAWGRNFKLVSELYGKYLWDVVPYDIDNVRLRYYAQNSAVAFAGGADFRVSGEFIKGTESWFSLGIMQTKEKVDGSTQGWIRRPTDQRLTFACFFQDHIPNNPSWKIFINLVFGTGLPFGIPNSPNQRNILEISPYRRLDVGFAKVLVFNNKNRTTSRFFESISLGVEVLNILGINNTLSYIWVSDFENRQYAIPQTLSQRFVNGKITASF
ncbi:MAG: carboxypeptidase-like regulatory domain-containing protein [Cytophagales bacterium]